MIYPITDSRRVSPVHVIPKKSRVTVEKNADGVEVPVRKTTGWCMYIDCRKLNVATRKDHFPLPFIDEMLNRLAGRKLYCLLDGLSGFYQIPIAREDQEILLSHARMGRLPIAECHLDYAMPQQPSRDACYLSFSDMVQDFIEVFMDDFSLFGDSFSDCLSKLDQVLKRYIECNLTVSWEMSHFMVTEGIVLGHLVSVRGIEVDKAKLEVITKLPPPLSLRNFSLF